MSNWIIEGQTHTHTIGNILSMFLFEFIVELILSSKILCTLRCVTFINLTTSYDKQNACSRYGCCRWCWCVFSSILKKIDGKHWVKEIESLNHIKFNDVNSMVMTKTIVTRNEKDKNKHNAMHSGKTDGAHAKKPTTTNLNAIQRMNWMKICYLFFAVSIFTKS